MNNKNLPIIIGIALPVIFIIAIFFIVSSPVSRVNPQYSFVYTLDGNQSYYYQYKNTYELSNGKIVSKSIDIPKEDPYYKNKTLKDYPTMYIYDVKNDTSKELSLPEAQKYELVVGPSSPDGYTVEYVYGNTSLFDEILLGGSNRRNNGYYITKGYSQKKLNNIVNPYDYYGGNFRIIGWIK